MAINKTDKVLNVPTLRFPGFTDKWETSRLSSYLIENKERNRNNEFGKDKVLSVSGEEGIVNQIEHLGRSFAGKSVSDYHVVRHGNIVYTKSPLKEYPYGIVKYNRGVDGIVSTLYAVYESKDSSYGPFVEYYFALATRVNRYFKPIVRIGAKHDMKIGNEEVLQNTVIFPNIEEQKKIADFLSLLDERIALQSKLIDRLKSLMDGIIDKVTALTPNISIRDCLDCYSSTLQECETEEQGTYPVYGANGVCGYLDYATISAPAILIVKDGSGVGNVSYANGDCSVVGTLNYLQPKKDVSAKFLYFVLKRFNFQPYKTGMAIPHIYFKAYSKTRIFCPDYEEQTRMAASLSRIEDKIALEERLLCLQKEQKHYLLSAMFI